MADNTKIPYWQLASQGIARAAAEMKVHQDVQGPDGHDPQGEHDAFKRAVAMKPSGILVSATDASILTPDINAALDQNIPGHHHRFRCARQQAAFLRGNR